MRSSPQRLLGAAAAACLTAASLAACGPGPDAPAPMTGLVVGEWRWVAIDGATCQDGSPTGVAVSPGAGPDLVVFLNGGGACWDYLSCAVLDLATSGPFGEAEFAGLRDRDLPGSILDRALAGNPYADATLVFVPYCTGDVHAGSRVATYSGAGGTVTWRHVGRRNIEALLPRLRDTFPAPRRLVVAGASAGGFGALLTYDLIRRTWPGAEGVLVDDSGPPLAGQAVPPLVLESWRASWGVDGLLDPLCGTPCRSSFGPLLPAVAARWPADRLAVLSSLRDAVIAGYFQLTGPELEAALLETAVTVVGPLPGARIFLEPGDGHAMLADPAGHAQGLPLLEWLGQQAAGDAGWASQLP